MNPQYQYPIIHDLILYSVAIGLAFGLIILTWSAGDRDLFGIGEYLSDLIASFGGTYDVFAARA